MRWLLLAGLIGIAIWYWAGPLARARAVLEARAKPGPCALSLEEVRARMRFHGTLVAFCDGTGWKFPRGEKVCRLWGKHGNGP